MTKRTRSLIDFAFNTDFKDLPADVVEESKRITLDSIGCAIAGLSSDKGKISVGLSRQLGGPKDSTILGVGEKVSCANAAFANAELISALEFGVYHPAGHITPFVLSAQLALAEQRKATGKDFITAIALAHEIAARVVSSLDGLRLFEGKPPEVKQVMCPSFGYSPSIFGGVAGAGRILRLNREQMMHAFGIAGHITPAHGVLRWLSSHHMAMHKHLFAGWISQAEVTATLLAEKGYTGDVDVLDGDLGSWRSLGSSKCDWNKMLRNLGSEWVMLETTYKPYPCWGSSHAALDMFKQIIDENGLSPNDIETVIVLSDPLMMLGPGRQVKDQIDAQFSVPYAIAVTAFGIRPPKWQDSINDTKIIEFMGRVSVKPHPKWAQERYKYIVIEGTPFLYGRPTRVEVSSKGRTFAKETGYPEGKRRLMTEEELAAKFRENASDVLGSARVEKAIKVILNLERSNDLDEMMRCATTEQKA